MKIKFKNIRKGKEDLHADEDLTNEDLTNDDLTDEQSSELLNLEIETYYTYPNGSTLEYDPNARTFTLNDVTTGMGTTYTVPPSTVEKPEVIEYGDAAIDLSELSNEEQYRINLLLRLKNFVHSDFYKRLSALKSSMTEEQFKQYEDANKYLSIDDNGVLDLSDEPYSVLTAVLDALEGAGYKLREREEPIVKTKENPHNLSLREIDWAYAELNFPALVTHPEEYHDPNTTNIYYNSGDRSIMTLSNYNNWKTAENALVGTGAGIASTVLLGGLVKYAPSAAWRGLKFLGKSLIDPGSFVDWVGLNAISVAPLARNWFGASTLAGAATNLGMSGYFGYDAYKGLRENGLNWKTGLETGFAALPFVAEGAPYVVKGITKGIDRINKSIKYLDTTRTLMLIEYLMHQRLKSTASEYQKRYPIKEEELDEFISKFLNSNASDADKKIISDAAKKRLELKLLIEKAEKERDDVINMMLKDPYGNVLMQKNEKAHNKVKELTDQYDALLSTLCKKLNIPFTPTTPIVNHMQIYKDIQDLEQVLKSLGIIKDSDKLILSGNSIYIKHDNSLHPFTLAQDKKIPILDASGKQIGELPVTTNTESGKAIISDEYIETTTNNIKALQAKFPGAKPFGSSVMVSDLQVPHFTHDYDFIITEEDAAKIAGLDKVLFNPNGFTKTVGIDANGNIVPANHGIFNVDLNIIRSGPDGKVIHNNLTEELFRHQYPELNSELTALSFTKDSNKHKVDIPLTPEELLDGYDPVVNTFLDSHEINFMSKPKHKHRILGYIIYNQNPKKIEECITQLARAQGLTEDWRAPRSIFNNVEENKQFLRNIGFSEEDVADIATNPEVMQNLFDYWTLDKIVRRRGVYNKPTRTGIDFNDPLLSDEEKREMLLSSFREWMSIGQSANGPGLNTVRGTSGVVGSGNGGGGSSFDIVGTFSLKPDFSGCKTLTEAFDKVLYTVGAEEYGGAFPEILQGMSPMWFLRHHSMTPSEWKPVSKELSDAGVLALTYSEDTSYMDRAGEYSTVVDDPNRNPIFSYLLSLIGPMTHRIVYKPDIESETLSMFPYLVVKRETKAKGTIYPNVIERLRKMIKEIKNANEEYVTANAKLSNFRSDYFRSTIGKTEFEINANLHDLETKLYLASLKILQNYYSILSKNGLDKLNKKIDKLISFNNVASGIENTLFIAKWGSIIAGVILAIAKMSKYYNKFHMTIDERSSIDYSIRLLKERVNELDEELKVDEKHRDDHRIYELERGIYNVYNKIYNIIKDPARKYLVEQYMQQQLPDLEQIKALFENEIPKDKQGGKLIPRNKFLSIYRLI